MYITENIIKLVNGFRYHCICYYDNGLCHNTWTINIKHFDQHSVVYYNILLDIILRIARPLHSALIMCLSTDNVSCKLFDPMHYKVDRVFYIL